MVFNHFGYSSVETCIKKRSIERGLTPAQAMAAAVIGAFTKRLRRIECADYFCGGAR
ncbi:hypothetical protein JUNP479_1840 [Aeromonas jandaei]|nr:hypothetical protein JUNP479_1840 [Aeromonas jandaei]